MGRAWARSSCATSSARACCVHLVDVSDASGRPDPVEDFKVINKELASFGANGISTEKPMIVVATKIDAANPEKLKKLSRACQAAQAGVPCDLRCHRRRESMS